MSHPLGDAYLGLDLGTTSIKAVAFDGGDREIAAASLPTPTQRLADGGAEYDADALWSTAAAVLRDVAAAVEHAGYRPLSIAVASMGEAGVLLDGFGRPVAPVIAWFDERTAPQAQWWIDVIGVEATRQITGLTPRLVFGAPKMLWTKQNLPDAWLAGERWLNMADWAAYRLSGEMATDHSIASRTMLFDLGERRWSQDLIEAADLDLSMLAPLIASGERVGSVSAEAAAETGLPAGLAVGAGGQDHVCAALALGVTAPGMLLDSIGTAEAFFLVTDDFDRSGRIAASGVNQGAHVAVGRTYAMTGLAQGGGRIDARRHELGLDWESFLATADAETVIEEVAVDGQARISLMLEVAAPSDVRHVATGGGSRNSRLMERKRELGGRPIKVAEQTQATALGAAMLGRQAI